METVWDLITAFHGIVRKKALLECTEETMGGENMETSSIEMLLKSPV